METFEYFPSFFGSLLSGITKKQNEKDHGYGSKIQEFTPLFPILRKILQLKFLKSRADGAEMKKAAAE